MLRRAQSLALISLFTWSGFSFAAENTVASLQKKYIEKSCEETNFLKTSRLSCISCGIEKFTGMKPSEKYLALLGFTTSKYAYLGRTENERGTLTEYGHAADGTKALELFQRNVIEKVQATGFCVDGKVDRDGNLIGGKGYGKIPSSFLTLVYSSISGSRSTNSVPVVKNKQVVGRESSTGYTTDQEKELVKFYGLKNVQQLKNLYEIEGWTYLTPSERQKVFRANLSTAPEGNPYAESSSLNQSLYNVEDSGEGLKECMSQLNSLQTKKDSIFNLKQKNSENQEICQLMAVECDIPMDFCTKTPVPAMTNPGSNSNSGTGSSGGNLFNATKKTDAAK